MELHLSVYLSFVLQCFVWCLLSFSTVKFINPFGFLLTVFTFEKFLLIPNHKDILSHFLLSFIDLECIGLPGGASDKEPACQCRRQKNFGFDPWVRKISWKRAWPPTPVFLPGESHGQRSLAGYSPWGRTELNTTEGLGTHQNAYSYVGWGSSFGFFRWVALSLSTPFI